jgi:hypothetical protein
MCSKLFRNRLGIRNDQLTENWITDELIQTHRSRLIQKEIEKEPENYKKLINHRKKKPNCFLLKSYEKWSIRLEELEGEIYRYRNLWLNTPTDLPMRYDWRDK